MNVIGVFRFLNFLFYGGMVAEAMQRRGRQKENEMREERREIKGIFLSGRFSLYFYFIFPKLSFIFLQYILISFIQFILCDLLVKSE